MTPDEQMSALLKGLGDRAVELNTWFFGPVDVHRVRAQLNLSREETAGAMATLVEKRIVELQGDGIGSFSSGNLTDVGLDCYMQACRPSYPQEQLGVRRKLAEYLIKETPDITNLKLVAALGYPRLVVDHVLRVFGRHGLLEIMGPGPTDVGEVFIGFISQDIVGGQLLGYSV